MFYDTSSIPKDPVICCKNLQFHEKKVYLMISFFEEISEVISVFSGCQEDSSSN